MPKRTVQVVLIIVVGKLLIDLREIRKRGGGDEEAGKPDDRIAA